MEPCLAVSIPAWWRSLVPIATLIALVGCGPMLLLPGGELEGSPAAAPGDWDFAELISTVQLETRPTDPYSVNVWAVGMGAALYLHAGANRSKWVENMQANPLVRVRVERRIFELTASRVTEQGEFARFADRYEEKYGNRPRNEKVDEIYLYRLVAR
jgi:hypothetical protein